MHVLRAVRLLVFYRRVLLSDDGIDLVDGDLVGATFSRDFLICANGIAGRRLVARSLLRDARRLETRRGVDVGVAVVASRRLGLVPRFVRRDDGGLSEVGVLGTRFARRARCVRLPRRAVRFEGCKNRVMNYSFLPGYSAGRGGRDSSLSRLLDRYRERVNPTAGTRCSTRCRRPGTATASRRGRARRRHSATENTRARVNTCP